MSTLIRIPAGHMRFVPAHKQSDEATPVLSPARWPVEFVLIASAKAREIFLCHDRINQILRPAIQATCLLKPEQTIFPPTPLSARGRFRGRLTPTHRRPLSPQPATPAQTSPRGPVTPPNRALLGNINGRNPAPQLNTHPDASHPQPGEPAGIGTPHEEATAAILRTHPPL